MLRMPAALFRFSRLAALPLLALPMPTTQLLLLPPPLPPASATLRSAVSVPALAVPGLSVAPAFNATSPLNVEFRLLVLPTVSALPFRLARPAPFRAPRVWPAPRLRIAPLATVTLTSDPSAPAAFRFSVPALTFTADAGFVMVPAAV